MAAPAACSKCANMLVAASHGHVECAKALLAGGADANYAGRKGNDLPIHLAANNGFVPILELLLQNGANINAQNKKKKNTPLHRASMQGKVDAVGWLLAHGAAASLQITNKKGQTPEQAATDPKHSRHVKAELVSAVVKLLQAAGQ